MALPKNDWKQGEFLTAAQANLISDTLDDAHDVLGDVALNIPTLADVSSARFYFFHRFRYLYFMSTGTIEDINGVFDSVSISEEDGQPTRYDLDSIPLLSYGQLYRVTGVSWCAESDT